MNKQLKLDDEARQMLRVLGTKLMALADEQDVQIWHGHFEWAVLEADKQWFSYHPSQYYLDDPTMTIETTLKEIHERGVKFSEGAVQQLQAEES